MLPVFKKIFGNYMKTSGTMKFSLVILFGMFSAVFGALEPVLFTKIIEEIESFYKTGVFDSDSTTRFIIIWAIFIIVSIFFHYIYRYFFVYKLNMKNYVELCKEFNDKILHMGYGEYLGKKQGSLYKIYDRGTQGQESFLYFFFGDLVKNFAQTFFLVFVMFYIDARMALLALSMIPIMFMLGFFFINKLSVKQRVLHDRWDSMFGIIGNILSSFMLTKILCLEKIFVRDMSRSLDILHREQNQIGKGWSLGNVYTAFLVMISRILVLGFGVHFVIDGSLSFAGLFLIFSIIGWIYFPLAFIIDRFSDIVKHLTAVEKMYNEFEHIEREDIYTGKTIKKPNGDIEFRNVSFGYSQERKILHSVSLKAKSGQKIALVGDTGSGKSTIVNLLLRFWDTTSGEILLDGQDIQGLKKTSLRSHIGVVSQDNSLFNLSIEENLKFANQKATKSDIEKALKKAEATFVFDLPQGIKTVIGERGLKLSGGEKQRISIARLFLKDPEILVLDEATSALDNRTEKQIQKSLDTLMKGKTSIIIAHRLSTIQHADLIYVLENGKIVESGNYEELMKREKKFFALANPEKLMLG